MGGQTTVGIREGERGEMRNKMRCGPFSKGGTSSTRKKKISSGGGGKKTERGIGGKKRGDEKHIFTRANEVKTGHAFCGLLGFEKSKKKEETRPGGEIERGAGEGKLPQRD